MGTMRAALLCWLVLPVLALRPAAACGCKAAPPVCDAVSFSDTIFIGTVISVSPAFLDDWSLARRPSLAELNRANDKYLNDHSAASLAALKEVFRKTFPDLAEDQRADLDKASSQKDLVGLFSAVLGHGKQVRFRVRTIYRHGDDDDDKQPAVIPPGIQANKKGDDDDQPKHRFVGPIAPAGKPDDDDTKDQTWGVWTPFGDCGYDFQVGETYLVYADNDEDTNILSTDTCSRTRRLSDAGSDLAYLYFYKEQKDAAGHVEGFTTLDTLYQVKAHDADTIEQPVPGVTVELKSAAGSRYTAASAAGKFWFDGLAAGDYQLSAYAPGFPDTIKLLSGPKRFRMDARGCSTQILLLPKLP